MPPLHGPRALLCWTRNPWKTLMVPSSILMGSDKLSALRGERKTSRIPGANLSFSAAASNCRIAMRKGLRSSVVRGTAFIVAMGGVVLSGRTRWRRPLRVYIVSTGLCLSRRLRFDPETIPGDHFIDHLHHSHPVIPFGHHVRRLFDGRNGIGHGHGKTAHLEKCGVVFGIADPNDIIGGRFQLLPVQAGARGVGGPAADAHQRVARD